MILCYDRNETWLVFKILMIKSGWRYNHHLKDAKSIEKEEIKTKPLFALMWYIKEVLIQQFDCA